MQGQGAEQGPGQLLEAAPSAQHQREIESVHAPGKSIRETQRDRSFHTAEETGASPWESKVPNPVEEQHAGLQPLCSPAFRSSRRAQHRQARGSSEGGQTQPRLGSHSSALGTGATGPAGDTARARALEPRPRARRSQCPGRHRSPLKRKHCLCNSTSFPLEAPPGTGTGGLAVTGQRNPG